MELYRTASDMLQKPLSEIPASAADISCLTFHDGVLVDGFNTVNVTYNMTLLDDKTFYFKARDSPYGNLIVFN